MNEPSDDPVSLVLLQTFHEVARTGSVQAAARSLGRSQPAVSHRLRALEEDLGFTLFERVGRRLRLTEHGHRLLSGCHDLMALARGIRGSVRAGELGGRVVIGTLPTLTSHFLVPEVTAFVKRFPRVRLEFEFALVSDLVDRLRVGRIDAMLVPGRVDAAGVEVERLGEITLTAVMSPADAPRKRGTVSPAELRRHRYLAWGGLADETMAIVERYAAEKRLADAYSLRVPHIESLRELVAAGAGYAILPAYTARADAARGRIVLLHPAGLDGRLPLQIVRRRSQLRTPLVDEVDAMLRRATACLRPPPGVKGQRPPGKRSS